MTKKKNNSISNNLTQIIQKRSDENFDLYENYINPHFVKLLKLAGFAPRFTSSEGIELIDHKGNHYLDFCSGYGVHNIGHNHPKIKAALIGIIEQNLPSFIQVECNSLTGLTAEKLVSLLPPKLNRVYFCNSGSEAVDASIKLSRSFTNRKRIVCCDGAFHGNTLGVLGLTDNPHRRDRYHPLIPGIVRIPYNDIKALENILRWKDVAAFIVEPVLGEGGAITPDINFLSDAKSLCIKYEALLILDEIQTGLGRCGKMFAFEYSGIKPDIITLAKSLSGGIVPVGAMIAREDIFKKAYGSLLRCLDQRTTFSGGTLAMAAAYTTLDILESEELIQNSSNQGIYFKEKLIELKLKHKSISEVRGRGLLLGIKFNKLDIPGLNKIIPDNIGKAGSELLTQYISLELMKKYKIISQVPANDFSVLKIMPPLIINRKSIDLFISALDEILSNSGYFKAVISLAKEIYKSD